jgi:hypothetical protein
MTYHVDVIQTDWAAGVERLAARLVLNGAGVHIEKSLGEPWRSKLLSPIPNGFGETLEPEDDPKFFLHLLAERLAEGTYVHAFAPHEDSECPFEGATERSMTEITT